MEGVYFVLGMVAILLVLGILIVFIVMNKIERLEEEVQYLERGSHDVAVDLHRRIDDEVRMLQSNIDENERDLLSHIDSRLNEKK